MTGSENADYGSGIIRCDGGEELDRYDSDSERYADPCVKHRCGLCHQIFDAAIHGANCPDCGGAAFCTFTEEGCT